MSKFKFQWPLKFQKQKNILERKGAPLGSTDALGKFMQFGFTGAETPASAISLYKESSAVSTPINRIAEAFSILDPVMQIDGKIIKKHPVLDLLKTPSPFYDQVLFLESIAKYYLITNEVEIIAIGNINRPPIELQPINPANANIIERGNGLAGSINITGTTLPGQFNLQLKNNKARYIQGNLKEIKQIRGFSTNNNSLLRGQSLLVPAAKEARQHILGNNHNVSLLEKGGRVSLIFHFDSDFSEDDFIQARDNVRQQYGGANQAGQIGVTAGGKLSIKEIGVNNKDMDYIKLHNIAVQAIALQYKVPLPLITVEASTMNNYEIANLALYDDAVLPLADRIFGALSSFLLPRYGLKQENIRITYDIDTITALSVRRNKELKLRKELNVESDNEIRTLIGREPYKGGDVIYKPANLVPVGNDVDTEDLQPVILRDQNDN